MMDEEEQNLVNEMNELDSQQQQAKQVHAAVANDLRCNTVYIRSSVVLILFLV